MVTGAMFRVVSSSSSISWVAVKELKLRDEPPIMENQMEKKLENEMETGGI